MHFPTKRIAVQSTTQFLRVTVVGSMEGVFFMLISSLFLLAGVALVVEFQDGRTSATDVPQAGTSPLSRNAPQTPANDGHVARSGDATARSSADGASRVGSGDAPTQRADGRPADRDGTASFPRSGVQATTKVSLGVGTRDR